MKYTEFEAKVKEINNTWRVIHNGSLTIVTNDEVRPFVCVSKSIKYGLDTQYSERSVLIDSDSDKIARLAYELAATPLEEREEPKKYYYRLPYVRTEVNYLNYLPESKTVSYSNKLSITYIQNQFTRKEYAAIAKEKGIPEGIHIEEEV
ncbi:MAG: hypothetical protein ACTH8E_12245 [Brochothrix thermosphacta]|uniref:hypothetical protein n=1 Tax=Brochothrix thermosphacta TaxID=2756 RepID=UPI003F935DA5